MRFSTSKILFVAAGLFVVLSMQKAQAQFGYRSSSISDFHFSDSLTCHYNHAFTPSQLIAPGTLIVSGVTITATPSLHTNIDGTIRDRVQDFRAENDYLSNHYEDYIQYIPLGSVFALKVCGLQSEHEWRDLVSLTAGSCFIGLAINRSLKYTFSVKRPDDSNYKSFPSGHTNTAFLGAEILRREYGKEYPAVAVAGYTVATGIACMRVWHNRHWFSDLLGGAGFSILSVSITYWLAPYLGLRF